MTSANAALTAERDNLAAALRDTEDALKDAENKLANANAALQALRAEMEQRLREKDEEIEAVRYMIIIFHCTAFWNSHC